MAHYIAPPTYNYIYKKRETYMRLAHHDIPNHIRGLTWVGTHKKNAKQLII